MLKTCAVRNKRGKRRWFEGTERKSEVKGDEREKKGERGSWRFYLALIFQMSSVRPFTLHLKQKEII